MPGRVIRWAYASDCASAVDSSCRTSASRASLSGYFAQSISCS
uniref:Uncharacterized protein n=1 Tax=Ascaris lumbricoides TaxID=6252 RepID=A0A0M3INN2_ASCLU